MVEPAGPPPTTNISGELPVFCCTGISEDAIEFLPALILQNFNITERFDIFGCMDSAAWIGWMRNKSNWNRAQCNNTPWSLSNKNSVRDSRAPYPGWIPQ